MSFRQGEQRLRAHQEEFEIGNWLIGKATDKVFLKNSYLQERWHEAQSPNHLVPMWIGEKMT